jgi:hypothetical protein
MASRTKSYLMKEMLEVVRRLETHKKQEGRFNGAATISSIRNQVFGLSENQSTKCKRPLKLITEVVNSQGLQLGFSSSAFVGL